MMTFEEAVNASGTTTEEALRIYDQLEPVDIGFMIGTWRGSELPTGHPMDGMLESTGWYGKHFKDSESVHPLLFYTASRKEAFPVNPDMMPVSLRLPKIRGSLYHWLILGAKPIIKTRRFKARLRMTEHRGKLSATMIYDDKPINDVFRKVDDKTVLGVMDLRGLDQPYFFVLRRDSSVAIVGPD
jgi:hypothetical protein